MDDFFDWADVKAIGVLAGGIIKDQYQHPIYRLLHFVYHDDWMREQKPIADALREAYAAGLDDADVRASYTLKS